MEIRSFLGFFGFVRNDGVSGLSNSDPPDRNFEKFFDLADVLLGGLRKVLELSALTDRLVPAGKADVIHLDALEVLKQIEKVLKRGKQTNGQYIAINLDQQGDLQSNILYQ